MPFVNRKSLTLSVSPETIDYLDTIKKLYGFRSRGKFIDNLITYIYGLELIRLVQCLSPEAQHQIAVSVVNHFAKYGKARLEVESNEP
jgi:hypothetical protein